MNIDSNYSVHINLSFISKLFLISIICLAPFFDLQLAMVALQMNLPLG